MKNTKNTPNPPELQDLLVSYKLDPSEATFRALQAHLSKHFYHDLLHDAARALGRFGIYDEALACNMVSDFLTTELNRVLLAYDYKRSFIMLIKGFMRRDYANGIPFYLRERKKHNLSLDVKKLPFEKQVSSLASPEEEFFEQYIDFEANDDLIAYEQLDVLQEISSHAEKWACEDESKPKAIAVRSLAYQLMLKRVIELLREGQEPFTATGRLRLGRYQLRYLAEKLERSERKVRDYLRALEPRLIGLKA